jgi:hypothetical protein
MQEELGLTVTHHFLSVYDVESLGKNTNTLRKMKKLVSGQNADRAQYMSLHRHQNAGQTTIQVLWRICSMQKLWSQRSSC